MIEVKHISKHYGKKQILNDLSFQVEKGERVVIVGKNGSGKTTLLRIMSGLIKPDMGEIIYCGKTTKGNSKLFRKHCGYVPQENPLMEELSVKDNLRLWSNDKENCQNIIERFQLQDILKMQVMKLSGGMKRRLSIACALLNKPEILILDEPTTALDLFYKDDILMWLKAYQNDGGVVLMTSHDETEILSADRCLVLSAGQLLEFKKDEISIEKIKAIVGINNKEERGNDYGKQSGNNRSSCGKES